MDTSILEICFLDSFKAVNHFASPKRHIIDKSEVQVLFTDSWSSVGAAHNTVSIFPRTLEDNSVYSSLTAAGVDLMTSSLLDREDSTKTFSQSQMRRVSRKQPEQNRKSNTVPTK